MSPDLSVLPLSLTAATSEAALQDAFSTLEGAAATAILQVARNHAAQGHGDEAICLYRLLLNISTASAHRSETALELAHVLSHFGRPEAVLDLIELEGQRTASTAAAEVVSQQLIVTKGMALAALGRGEDGLALLDEAAAFYPRRVSGMRENSNRRIIPLDLARARVLLSLHRPLDALQALSVLQETLPGDADILTDVLLTTAAIHLALHRPMQAVGALDSVLSNAPRHSSALLLYGQAMSALGENAFAVDCFERALTASGPAMRAPAYRYMAGALVMQGLDDEALACLRAARESDPACTLAWLDEAGIRLRRGELSKGFEAYEWRDDARFAKRHGAAFWNGETPLPGVTLLVVAEQGLGDTLHFIRYAPELVRMGANVIVEVQAPLYRLIAASAENWGVTILRRGDPRPPCDRYTLLMSLPFALRTRMNAIPGSVPYLGVRQDRSGGARKAAKARRPARLRIGIVPSGNPEFRNDAMRSLPLQALAPVLATPGVEAVLLTPTPREADLTWARAHPELIGLGLADPTVRCEDFADTADYLADLDLVISVDTAVAHLAGALGQPVWILLPHVADWRWMMHRDDSPWYPSARLFRQCAIDDWIGVVTQVSSALLAMTTGGET